MREPSSFQGRGAGLMKPNRFAQENNELVNNKRNLHFDTDKIVRF